MKNFMKEFKEFALKGNMMDLAIGMMIGAAFGKIVTSLVSDILMPLISGIFRIQDFTALKVLLVVIFGIACVLTNFMSNTATTALLVPIGLSIAASIGADPRAVLMAIVIGGSCAYATPIGMPANTMVLAAGGYRFMDFVRAGLPLIVVSGAVSIPLLLIFFPFFPG